MTDCAGWVAAIVGMVVVFAGVNFYMLFLAVYNIGREDARREKVIEITPLSVPDIVPHGTDTLSRRTQREMEEFFNQFNFD